MTILMSLEKLSSRVVRYTVGDKGIRKLTESKLGKVTVGNKTLTKFLGIGLLRFGGFLVADVITFLTSMITLNFASLWGGIIQTLGFLWNFDWNKSDAEFQREADAQKSALAGLAGYAVGDALGYLACGVLPNSTIHVFNKALALEIFERLGETALGSVAGNVAVLIQMTFQSMAYQAFSYYFTSLRSLFRPSDEDFTMQLIKNGTFKKEDIDKALEQRNKPWSFNKEFQSQTEKIENKDIKEFVQQGVQGLIQSCIQSGFIIAGGIDSYLAQAKAANKGVLGLEEGVEILIGKKASPTSHSQGGH